MTQITVTVEETTGRYILRRSIGDGHCNGYNFDLSVTIPDGAPFITVDGKSYMVDMESIVEAVIGAVTKPPAPAPD